MTLSEPNNFWEALEWGFSQLLINQIDEPRFEAEILLCHALNAKKSILIAEPDRAIKQATLSAFKKLIKRRIRREPTAYITNIQPFLSLDFRVDQSVLIPRPETELLVETAIEELQPRKPSPLLIADIGTGSGVIAICLAKALPSANVIGIDSSEKALEIARKNSLLHAVSDRCQFYSGNLFEPLKEKVDLIISNPPYIPSNEIEKLQPEVRDWEPRQALEGGKDGLDCIRQIITKAPEYLKPGGKILLEFGIDQSERIKQLAEENFIHPRIIRDYSGKERIFLAESKHLQNQF